MYARYFKTNPHAPQPLHQHQLAAAASSKRARKPPPLSHCAITAAQRRRLLPPVQIAYALSEGEVEDDLEFLLAEAEKDKARALTAGARADADATRADEGSEEDGYEVTYDKVRPPRSARARRVRARTPRESAHAARDAAACARARVE